MTRHNLSIVKHTVAQGEDLYHIGKHYGVNWRIIGHFNNLENGNVVHPGQEIGIPPYAKELSDLVEILNKWLETRDRSDVTELAVAIENHARGTNATNNAKNILSDTLTKYHLRSELDLFWAYHVEGKLLTISWFIGEFAGEWRKHLNPDTR